MDPGAGRLPVQVVGENEALQQFFNGLDSSVAVDTSILEEYLGNDMDPSSFMLPESPPDSSSEACSPPQIPDFHYEQSYSSTQEEMFQPTSCHFNGRGSTPSHPDLLTHQQLRHLGLTNTYIKSPSTPLQQPSHHSPASCSQGYTPPTPPSPPPLPSSRHGTHITGPGVVSNVAPPISDCLLGSASSLHPGCTYSKKRRRSESEDSLTAVDMSCCDGDGTHGPRTMPGPGLGGSQMLTWDQYRPEDWSCLYDGSFQKLSSPAYHVDTDKGFNFSPADEAFVCQKKNHFQVTIHIGVSAEPRYVQTASGPQEVHGFQIKVFGIKMETPSYLVTIEQSQPDRSKKPFHPVDVSLPAGKITKVTLGRLHFSETTANNMRKKGRPNPEQRYFQMVVGLYAAVGKDAFLLTALVSERIIVRASNPGQFETDGDALWQRGVPQDATVCHGRVGINTDSPDEALVVCGNAKVMGTIMQPSDCRAKKNIQEVDSEQQLKRITQMRIVEFDYKPEFASSAGIDHAHQTGVIAQEVKKLLPSAVMDVGDVTCSDGEKIQNFLMVDKEQIFMENVGAVQQLSKLTDNLETRIQDLEVWNRRLAKLKSLTGSLRSSRTQRHTNMDSLSSPESTRPGKARVQEQQQQHQKSGRCLQKKMFRVGVFTLLATMAFCVISISALYLTKLTDFNLPDHSNDTIVTMTSTTWTSTVLPTSPPSLWPPSIDFCELLYCEEVHCCPSPARGSSQVTSIFSARERRKSSPIITRHLKSSADWKNTSIHTFMIKENQQVIDTKYCLRDECGPERFIYRVPISQFVPVNMRITLLMNSTELLVVHLCNLDESTTCSALMETNSVIGTRYPSNTQGEHEWPLHVARLYQGSYHFRSAVAGQADCSTDRNYAGALFTDYHFYFYRHCMDSNHIST